MSTTIELYEDNGGQLYMRRAGDDFYFADVEHMPDGTFAEEAKFWATGTNDIDLPTYDGEVPGLLVATWRDGEVTVLRNEYSGEEVAGYAGRSFIGIERED